MADLLEMEYVCQVSFPKQNKLEQQSLEHGPTLPWDL